MVNLKLEKIYIDSFLYKQEEITFSNINALLIKNISAGICGTDIEIAKGRRNDLASIIGHEGIGIVTRSNVSTFKVNDIIVYNPVSVLNQDRILGHSYDGIFQQYYLVNLDDLENDLVIKLPCSQVELFYGALLEPLAVAIYGIEIVSTATSITNSLIIGTGAISHVIAYYLANKGVKVYMASHSDTRAKILSKCNNCHINYLNLNEAKKLNIQFDVIFSCAPRIRAMDYLYLALKLSRKNTVIDLVNGFNEDTYFACNFHDGRKSISLNEIRRRNCCGSKHDIFKINYSGKYYNVTGHRGCNKSHFLSAYDELSRFESHYSKLINLQLNFNEVDRFFNNSCKTSINHTGKILIKFEN